MPQDQPPPAEADEALADMLEQSERFEGDLAPLLAHPRRPPSRRVLLTLALCDVALEFWVAHRLLIRAGMHTAALALVRLHFEATVRAIRFHHGASDDRGANVEGGLAPVFPDTAYSQCSAWSS